MTDPRFDLDPAMLQLGAHPHDAGCRFTVWAPHVDRVDVEIVGPPDAVHHMDRLAHGYFTADVADVGPGDRYWFRLDGNRRRADPAARFQPDGVGGPGEVIDPAWAWRDDEWRGVELDDLVVYELHVGTYTPAGTFDAVIDHLDHLRRLGVTAIELMPIAQFPGCRNWGYDGVGLFAAQHSYGGPDGLRRLVTAAHDAGLGVMLDVVYNHLGPEGNHLAEFGPYFTDRYRTPWGAAVNVDAAGSDEVRRFFIDNVLMWIADFHLDGLRLDAVHAIADASAHPFLEELAAAVHARADDLGRRVLVIAEDAANDPRLSRPVERGGLGLDAQWNDDFHHALHVALTGERRGYYRDFVGVDDVATALRHGYVYGHRHSAHRGHRVGRPAADADPGRLVVFAQNHDQIGNRAAGDRLVTQVGADAARAGAALVALAPGIPLLFMGEEWADAAPFQYFVDHADAHLLEAVRDGRRSEFASFGWQDDVADPADAATFERSRVDHAKRDTDVGAAMVEWYRSLLELRREVGAPRRVEAVERHDDVLMFVLRGDSSSLTVVVNLDADDAVVPVSLPEGSWQRVLASGETHFTSSVQASATVPDEVAERGSRQRATGTPSQSVGAVRGQVQMQLSGWGVTVLKRGVRP